MKRKTPIVFLLLFLLLSGFMLDVGAQHPPSGSKREPGINLEEFYRTKENKKQGKFLIGLSPIALSLGGIFSSNQEWQLGLNVGFGADFVNPILLAGGHFATKNSLAYETKDGETDKFFIDILAFQLFAHKQVNENVNFNVGGRASFFVHLDSSSNNFGGGNSIGLFIQPSFGKNHVWFSPRLFFGRLNEGGDLSEFAIILTPLILRLKLYKKRH